MNRRGFVLALLMVVLLSLVAAGGLFTSRVSVDLAARRSGELRTQALWLARSALDAGVTGTRRVQTPRGAATVVVQRAGKQTTARVELAGALAEIGTDPWTERYQAPQVGAPGG